MNLTNILATLKLLRKAFGSYTLRIITMAILGFVGGILGGIGIGAIVPLFSFISDGRADATNNISKIIQRLFSFAHLKYNLTTLIIIIALLFVAKALFLYFANYISTKIVADYARETRDKLFKKTLRADWPYLLEQKIGHLETIIITDTDRGSEVLDTLGSMILLTTSLLAYSIVAINISPAMTFLTLGLGIVLFFILKPLFYKIRKLSWEWARSSKAVANQVAEYVIGAKAIKVASAENAILAKIQKYFNTLRETRIRVVLLLNLQAAFHEPISLAIVLAIFTFSYTKPGFQLSAFIAVIYLIQKMFSFMQSIQGKLGGINEAAPFLKAVMNYEDQADGHKESGGAKSDELNFENTIEFKNVKFAYNGREEILSGLDFYVKKGEMVGFIGPSGAGKTTIVDLILKLFIPSSGQILLDGKNISEINTRNWRKNISYVSQDIFLLSDTIENNIKFYDQSISQTDVIAAAKMANIYDVIQEQPDKFLTVVGERGVKLSAGQRQRLVLARALARKPKILILDEATSALDNKSEALIQNALENLKKKITILVIAHRLSTVMSCDRLVALENGKIIEQGSPQDLLKNESSYFYKIYNIGTK